MIVPGRRGIGIGTVKSRTPEVRAWPWEMGGKKVDSVPDGEHSVSRGNNKEIVAGRWECNKPTGNMRWKVNHEENGFVIDYTGEMAKQVLRTSRKQDPLVNYVPTGKGKKVQTYCGSLASRPSKEEVGTWKNGELHGEGYQIIDGQVLRGKFVNGYLSEGELFDGTIIDGESCYKEKWNSL